MKLLYCISFISLFFGSCKKKESPVHPEQESITESVYASGVIKSNQQYQVFSSVNGIIKNILVTEGDAVKEGMPIIQLVNTTPSLNVENATINAEYGSVKANSEKLNELILSIDQARFKMDNDASLLEKQKNLWSKGIGTKNELDQRELSLVNSSKNYQSLQLRLQELKKQLLLQEKQSQKNVEITRQIANDYTIYSRRNGIVYALLKENGEMINTQTPLAVIGDSSFYLELSVDENDVNRVKTGQKIILNMDAYPGKIFEAVVTKINPIMNPQTKSFLVEADFVHPPSSLYPNLTAESNIVISTKEKAIIIPREYVTNDNFVILANKEKRKVTTGLKDYRKIEILEGLSVTDEIIKPTP